MIRRRAATAVVAIGVVLVGAGCTSSASDGGDVSSTSRASTTTTTRSGDLSPAAQRWVDLREDNDCQGTRFGEALEGVVPPEVFNERTDRSVTEEDWPEARRSLLPVARQYATTKQAMIEAVEAETWPPDAQQAVDDQLAVQRARVAWLEQIGAATTVEELNAVLGAELPMDRSPAVRAALEIPPTEEIHTPHFCATR